MARYIGPKTKISRKFSQSIYGYDKYFEKRKYLPGQHGPNKRRNLKRSQYFIQLAEKQKAKYIYGILERQFANMFVKAHRSKGVTGEVLLQLCESRLDNIVYRLQIAKTRNGARQLVTHKHITVNNLIVNIPSYLLKPGDIVGIKAKSKSLSVITNCIHNKSDYDWLNWNPSTLLGEFKSVPERVQIPEVIKEQLIVELYSK